MNAPATCRSGRSFTFLSHKSVQLIDPYDDEGQETRNQISHQGLGKNPSMICMARFTSDRAMSADQS